jgi:hypothetical protein
LAEADRALSARLRSTDRRLPMLMPSDYQKTRSRELIATRATETMGSDIDVLIIGSVDFGAVIDALHPAQEQLAREINPKVFSTREWETSHKKKNPFATDIMTNPKIFLIGEERDVG